MPQNNRDKTERVKEYRVCPSYLDNAGYKWWPVGQKTFFTFGGRTGIYAKDNGRTIVLFEEVARFETKDLAIEYADFKNK